MSGLYDLKVSVLLLLKKPSGEKSTIFLCVSDFQKASEAFERENGNGLKPWKLCGSQSQEPQITTDSRIIPLQSVDIECQHW